MPSPSSALYELTLLTLAGVVLVWSGIEPRDRFTWLLEVAPVLIGVPVLVALRRRLRLTRLVYTLLWIHAMFSRSDALVFGSTSVAAIWPRPYVASPNAMAASRMATPA